MPISPELARTRSALATATRRGNPEEIEAARRDHAAAHIEELVTRILADAPPPTEEQLRKIAILLRGGGIL